MKVERAIFGLGNPGARYAGTRHNLGFDVIDRLVARHGGSRPYEKHRSWIRATQIGDVRALLVKPLTFMNDSGRSVRPIAEEFGLPLDAIWVVVDDFHLPLGTLRIRLRGSDGGHNGLASIIEALQSSGFPRFRLGIGEPRPGQEIVSYVLSRFPRAEREPVERLIDHTADAIEFALARDLPAAMSRFNGGPIEPD